MKCQCCGEEVKIGERFCRYCYNPIEYDLRFHRYIYRYYVPDEIIRKNYAPNMYDKGEKLIVAGHPQLDFYLNNKNQNKRKYVIYAPHWTVCGDNLRYSTFDWNGYKILEFAEKHPELNWVFKPHPCLYNFLFMYYCVLDVKSKNSLLSPRS